MRWTVVATTHKGRDLYHLRERRCPIQIILIFVPVTTDTDHYDRVLALAHAQGFTMGTSGPDKPAGMHSLSMIHGPFVLYGVNLEEVEAYIAESKVEGGERAPKLSSPFKNCGAAMLITR